METQRGVQEKRGRIRMYSMHPSGGFFSRYYILYRLGSTAIFFWRRKKQYITKRPCFFKPKTILPTNCFTPDTGINGPTVGVAIVLHDAS